MQIWYITEFSGHFFTRILVSENFLGVPVGTKLPCNFCFSVQILAAWQFLPPPPPPVLDTAEDDRAAHLLLREGELSPGVHRQLAQAGAAD